MVNDKAWQSTYRKDEFDENFRYVTTVVSEVRLKISRVVVVVKELILKIWGFECSDFISK